MAGRTPRFGRGGRLRCRIARERAPRGARRLRPARDGAASLTRPGWPGVLRGPKRKAPRRSRRTAGRLTTVAGGQPGGTRGLAVRSPPPPPLLVEDDEPALLPLLLLLLLLLLLPLVDGGGVYGWSRAVLPPRDADALEPRV